MRILVTGLNGFTGRYLQKELEAHGHEVIDFKSDLTNRDAVFAEMEQINADAVAHLAGIAFIGHGNIEDFYQVNLIGTLNLLQAIYKHIPQVQSILLASSSNVYGDTAEEALSETALPNPINDYAVSKLAMEQMAALWLDKLPIFITRPFNYTGIGQSDNFLIPKIVSYFKKKAHFIELGNLDVYREFNDVRMVSEVYRKLLEKSPASETINICTGLTHSVKEILKYCEQITNHKITIKVNPEFVRQNEIKSLCGINKNLKNLIGGWHQYTIQDTLRWMLNL